MNQNSTSIVKGNFMTENIKKIFYDKTIMNLIHSFLPEETRKEFKNLLKRTGMRDRKKLMKEIIRKYIVDFGKHQEKVKHRMGEKGSLIITTNVFNIKKDYLKEFDRVNHKDTQDKLELDKEELYEYLKVLPKFEFYLTSTRGDNLKLSKALIPYDTINDSDEEEEDDKKKYQMFYDQNLNGLEKIDFSDKEGLIQRQKKLLELMNTEKTRVFYPLEFICNVNYWTIILCQGGYFACGFFLRDKILEHKSDHKYVVRKKAGQRQITKDKSKNIKTSSNYPFNL